MTVRPVLEAGDDCSIHGLDPRLQLTPLPSLLQSASDFRNLDQLTTDQAGLASPEWAGQTPGPCHNLVCAVSSVIRRNR